MAVPAKRVVLLHTTGKMAGIAQIVGLRGKPSLSFNLPNSDKADKGKMKVMLIGMNDRAMIYVEMSPEMLERMKQQELSNPEPEAPTTQETEPTAV